jgi:diguanylate cyclase (GGDEF)-like protein
MSLPVARALLIVMPLLVATPAVAEDRVPPTVAERLKACGEVEDLDPARAVTLAGSVIEGAGGSTVRDRAEALGCRGWALATQGEVDAARGDAYALKALLAQIEAGADRVRFARRAGAILQRSDDRIGSVELYAAALAEAESLGLESESIPLLINLGVLHSELDDHERAQVNYEQALALMDRLDDHRHEAPVRYNLGLNYAGQNRHAEAVEQLQRVMDAVRDPAGVPPMQQIAIGVALAWSLQQIGEGERSRELIAWVRGSDVPIVDNGIRLSLALMESRQLADAGRFAEALAAFEEFELDGLLHLQQLQLLEHRAELLQRMGRHEEAIVPLRQITQLREQFLRGQNLERLAAMESRLRDREQRLEMQRLQAEAEHRELALERSARRWWQAVGVGSLLLVAAGAALFWQRRMNRRLDQASRTDPLTGLSNRRDMGQRMRELTEQGGAAGAVLLVDIDLFKRINDEYGHDVGDAVLVETARRLRSLSGEGAKAARWGGEEFLVLLPGADHDATRRLSEGLRLGLAEPIVVGERLVHAPVSIGYCNLPVPGARGADAWHYSVQLADAALYVAKDAGRDAWAGVWIDESFSGWPPERLAREFRLARILRLLSVESSRPLAASPAEVV